MDFTLSQRCTQWREAIRCFVDEAAVLLEEAGRSLLGPRFAMTEPAPGAGSDPAALRTTAASTGSGWVINGYDGASEVHRMSIAKRAARRVRADLASAQA